jgi:UDP-N-acetylglucosamine acyltransferase
VIDDTAKIHPNAIIGENVQIGPYCVIGDGVKIGDNCSILSHVAISGPTTIGSNNRIYQFCAIGGDPQDKKYSGENEASRLEIGEGNTFREYCTINRGTTGGGGLTSIGNRNWIMAYVHIAHDCHIGNDTIFANNATLAGHVEIDDYVILGGFTGVHQFCRIGKYSLTAISSVVVKDIPPYVIAAGNTASPAALNREGLKRHGFSSEKINSLKQAYKLVYRQGLSLEDSVSSLKDMLEDCPEVSAFIDFLESTSRGIAR